MNIYRRNFAKDRFLAASTVELFGTELITYEGALLLTVQTVKLHVSAHVT